MPQSVKSSSTSTAPRRRLGRGLTSLISKPVRIGAPVEAESGGASQAQQENPTAGREGADVGAEERGALRMIPIDRVQPNRYQPRKQFDESALEGLASSIREAGVMQPIVVRPQSNDGQYELIAGERRWRAAQRIGLERIPAVVRDVDHETAAQFALIENIQREDLNAIERAEAFARLADEFSLTHQEIAERVGLDRTSVTNHLRLLELDDQTRVAVAAGALTMGHGRALLAIPNLSRRRMLAMRAAKEGWSVREIERRARPDAPTDRPETLAELKGGLPVHIEDLQRKLGEHLGLKVRVRPGKKKGSGRLVVEFYSLDEFEGLLERLSFEGG